MSGLEMFSELFLRFINFLKPILCSVSAIIWILTFSSFFKKTLFELLSEGFLQLYFLFFLWNFFFPFCYCIFNFQELSFVPEHYIFVVSNSFLVVVRFPLICLTDKIFVCFLLRATSTFLSISFSPMDSVSAV